MNELKDKRFVKFLRRGATCEIKFFERLVFSYLYYKTAYGTTSTIQKISEQTGVTRPCVQKSLEHLRDLGLASANKNNWSAVEPKDENRNWFNFAQPEQKDKPKFMSYYKVYIPNKACPLTIQQCALYWLLWDLRKANGITRTTVNGLASLLTIQRKAVQRGLAALIANDLIVPIPQVEGYTFKPFPPEWVADQILPSKKSPVASEITDAEYDALLLDPVLGPLLRQAAGKDESATAAVEDVPFEAVASPASHVSDLGDPLGQDDFFAAIRGTIPVSITGGVDR